MQANFRFLFSALLFVSLFYLDVSAQKLSQVRSVISEIDAESDMKPATWSVCVREVTSGKVLIDHHASKSVVTASTMKVLTTATALALLGPQYRYETRVEYTGLITREGVLEGDIYIRGSGDPTLGSDRFGDEYKWDVLMQNWAERIRAAGIKRISGRIIADATIYDTQLTPGRWSWEDMGNYYGAGPGGLNINENLYKLYFTPGTSIGAITKVLKTEPKIPGLEFVNEITTGSYRSGDNGYIYGSPYTYKRYLRGTIPGGRRTFSIKGSIPDPALFTAQSLEKSLMTIGVKCAQEASSLRILGPETERHSTKDIFIYSSIPLSDIVTATNEESINLYAEALLKHIAVAKGKEGSTENGLDALIDFWESSGVNTKGMRLRDGSGLSNNNMLTTNALSDILTKSYRTGYGKALFESLPVMGKSGTLSGMGRGTAAEGRVHAKTGTISAVRAFAGYVKTQGGSTLAFAAIANNFEGSSGRMRNRLIRIMDRLARLQSLD